MALLETVRDPARLRRLDGAELRALAGEIREFLIDRVSATGGHLGPNLGVVELTIALHRVFDSPRDRLLWDTGHQAYVHKLLTGRQAGFDRLRRGGGLSGYPSAAESEHDLVENSHASTALSYADGLARAAARAARAGEPARTVVAVVGDGAMTGGMAWEALNNLGGTDRPLVIVLNDNQRSYAPTQGALADHLRALRTGWDGPNLFEQLGFEYLGPVDGHDIEALETALRAVRRPHRPVVVHAVTEKGRGFRHAERNEVDRGHAIAPMDPETGLPLAKPAGPTFTSVFGRRIVELAETRPDLLAITAAMLEPAGLAGLQERFPDRVIDVGIAEQHAVTMAAGLAMGGLRPVVAIYATFLNRAFDQLLMDVALHRCPVTFVLDRAGVTGDDGPSHNGVWDLSVLQVVPGLRVAAPRDGTRLAELLTEAVDWTGGPTLLRYPKGPTGPDVPTLTTFGGIDVLQRSGPLDVLVVSVGALAGLALGVAETVRAQGIGTTVVDPRWVRPVPAVLADIARRHRLVVTIEDSSRAAGVGGAVAQALRDAGVTTPLAEFGTPCRFLAHGKRAEVLAACGLTVPDVAGAVLHRCVDLGLATGAPRGDDLDQALASLLQQGQTRKEQR